MLGPITNFLTNPTLVAAQSTNISMSIQTGLKAAGRPAFTLIDNNVDQEARKYAAMKEFVYQVLCLGIYMAVIIPVFKTAGFQLCKKFLKEEGVDKFKNADEFLNYYKLATIAPEKRATDKHWTKIPEKFQEELKTLPKKLEDYPKELADLAKEAPQEAQNLVKKLRRGKGAIEFCYVIGSIVGLTILAPQVSHYILHPIMRACGMEKKKDEKPLDQNA